MPCSIVFLDPYQYLAPMLVQTNKTPKCFALSPFQFGNSAHLSWVSRIADGSEMVGVAQCMTHFPQVGVGQLGSMARYSGMR